jgi:hypothetical protein
MGGNWDDESIDGVGGSRCDNGNMCFYNDMEGNYHSGGCQEMATVQCRCVKYLNHKPSESIPHSGCMA